MNIAPDGENLRHLQQSGLALRDCAGSLRDPAKALPLVEAALRSVPHASAYHNTLGVVLRASSGYPDAIPELEKSLAAAPCAESPFDLYFLAICHFKLGDPDRAEAVLSVPSESNQSTYCRPRWPASSMHSAPRRRHFSAPRACAGRPAPASTRTR